MRRSEGFPSQTIWISGGAKPKVHNIPSKNRKLEIERNKKIALYEKALLEEADEKRARIKAEKHRKNKK